MVLCARSSKKHAEMVAHLRAVLQAEEGCCSDEVLQGYDLPAHTTSAATAADDDPKQRSGRGKKARNKRKQQRQRQQR